MNSPGEHGLQDQSLGLVRTVEENPALHLQSLTPSLPEGESEPSGQLRHVVEPDVEYLPARQLIQPAEPSKDLYSPALQIAHTPPLEPVNPLLHVQSLAALLPENEAEFAGQLLQVLDATAPVAVEYLLLTQSVQAAEPVEDLYFPGTLAEILKS